MELPALDVMSRALQGDPGARSFLERTTSIYVLDVTDTANPKTYGCWNFIHQALNEVERYERQHAVSGTTPPLVGHVRLLATMALRVARRSPSKDKALVATCLSNSLSYCASPSQSQWLVSLNLELREIVMGRIAAMAFDFSFHRMVGSHGLSSFADRVVMDTFCAILSANAVASGPQAAEHFATKWIIPSSRQLPAFALAAVVLHLALESMRKACPAGTKETLQKLSEAVIVVVLVPTLSDATTDNAASSDSNLSPHQESSRTAAMCFRAIKAWCCATDLSLPQINHVCNKASMNIVAILGDSMYSDSDEAIDALAELIEATVQLADEKVMSVGRMNQVRHLLQVDEATFRARFSPDQLKTIESREMGSIVEELVSAIGLQRFRFQDRQNRGEHGVCRNLARIVVSICTTLMDIPDEGGPRRIEPGALNLLLKAAAYPSVNVCSLALPVIGRLLAVMPSIAPEVLPMLQRLAITPHQFLDGSISFAPFEVCGVNATEFRAFREEVLSDALLACWKANNVHYIESCTTAVEEFCSERSSVDVSLQLEAALFCIEIVSEHAMRVDGSHAQQLTRTLTALATKPASLMFNALARARGCRMLRKYASWFITEGKHRVASDICLAAFIAYKTANEVPLTDDLLDLSPSPILEAALSLKAYLCRCPVDFVDDAVIISLCDAWNASVVEAEQSGRIALDARLALGTGLVSVFKELPDEEHSARLFTEMMAVTLSRLEKGSADCISAGETSESVLAAAMSLLADEIMLLSGLVCAFSDTGFQEEDAMDSETSTPHVPDHVVATLRKGWPSVEQSASKLSDYESIANALKSFFSDLMPLSLGIDDRVLFNDLCSVKALVLTAEDPTRHRFDILLHFLGTFVETYGQIIEGAAVAKLSGLPVNDRGQELGVILQESLVQAVKEAHDSLGVVWTGSSEQGNGQPPFESRSSAQQPTPAGDSLAGTLDLMTKCVQHCPLFALHVPAGMGMDLDEDKMLRRAVDSAAASLCCDDLDLSKSSINFMRVMANQTSGHAIVETFVSGTFSRFRRTMIDRLLSGVCGNCDVSMLKEITELLDAIVSKGSPSEVKSDVMFTLRGEYFLAGEPAKHATLSVLQQCQQRKISVSYLHSFLHDLWEMHQAEDAESLPTSDLVASFVHKYTAAT